MSNKLLIVKITLAFFLSVSFFTLFSNTHAEECHQLLWAIKPPQKETELKKLIDQRISEPEVRIARIEEKVSGRKEKYGDLLPRLARLEGSAKNEKEAEGVMGVDEQIQKIKEDLAAGKSRNEIEQALTATEWFGKARKLQQEIQGGKRDNLSKLEKVISYYSRAIKINPKYVEAYNNRGVAYDSKGDYERAISDYNRVILLNPKLAEPFNNRGKTYDDQGDLDRAISDYSQAILLNPKFAWAYKNRGSAYDKKGDYDRARSDDTQAILLLKKSKDKSLREEGET